MDRHAKNGDVKTVEGSGRQSLAEEGSGRQSSTNGVAYKGSGRQWKAVEGSVYRPTHVFRSVVGRFAHSAAPAATPDPRNLEQPMAVSAAPKRSTPAALTPLAICLYELRLARGLKQATLAKRAGVSQPLISALESGRRGRRIALSTVQAIAEALGVTVAQLTEPQPQRRLQV
jgi:DNA-binding XRE family transcriptional regulator